MMESTSPTQESARASEEEGSLVRPLLSFGEMKELMKCNKIEEFTEAAGRLNLNEQDEDGNTLLHIAVELRSLDFVEILLKKAANPNAQNAKGETALYMVCKTYLPETSPKLIACLLDRGLADPNVAEKSGKTPLMELVCTPQCDSEILSLLKKNGANPNLTSTSGSSALMMVCKDEFSHGSASERYESAEFLIKECKCDRSLQNLEGDNARDLAKISKDSEELLKAFPEDDTDEKIYASLAEALATRLTMKTE